MKKEIKTTDFEQFTITGEAVDFIGGEIQYIKDISQIQGTTEDEDYSEDPSKWDFTDWPPVN